MLCRTSEMNNKFKINLNSRISINLIDIAHLDLLPCFVEPKNPISIESIGKTLHLPGNQELISVSFEENDHHYRIEIEAKEGVAKKVWFYQNILMLTPETAEAWEEIKRDMSAKQFTMDNVDYDRVLGGDAELAQLYDSAESITSADLSVNCEMQSMLFHRQLANDGVEYLKISIEVNHDLNVAQVGFYVGVELHPSVITIL